MSSGGQRTSEQQSAYTRQATILRKNLEEWESMLRNPRGEDWPNMLGRLNAALNQTASMDRSIDDVLEHFVYVPKKSTANPQDIPFFLSTRLEMPAGSDNNKSTTTDGKTVLDVDTALLVGDPVQLLSTYENNATRLAAEYEESMVRF